MTLKYALKQANNDLKHLDKEEAGASVLLLAEAILGISRYQIPIIGDKEIDDSDCKAFFSCIKRRALHEPTQYIIGSAEFMGLSFSLSRDVLIPRPDTEILVEEAMLFVRDGDRILDLCTGTGCVLLSLLKYKNCYFGVGTDISEPALEIARKNADALKIQNALFTNADLYPEAGLNLSVLDPPVCGKYTFDIIVANPPYVKSGDISGLMPEIACYEPHIALDGGADGLKFYKIIIDKAPAYLSAGGHILLEVGKGQAADVCEMLREQDFVCVKTAKDLSGIDRVVSGAYGVMN